MGLRKIFDRLGDMLMPKELAPYASILAPMLTGPIGGFSGLGIGGGLALSQLASAKQNSGKLDPYSAFGVVAAGMTPQAQARRMAGRIDPSQGTLGQKLSGNFSKYLSGTGLNDSGLGQGIIRGIDPTRSMSMLTSGLPGKSYFESPAMADRYTLASSKDPSFYALDSGAFETHLEEDMATRYGSFKTDEELQNF